MRQEPIIFDRQAMGLLMNGMCSIIMASLVMIMIILMRVVDRFSVVFAATFERLFFFLSDNSIVALGGRPKHQLNQKDRCRGYPSCTSRSKQRTMNHEKTT